MTDTLERIKGFNADNQRRITVNVGVLRSAIAEINAHVSVNGKGVMTDMVLNALKSTIGEPADTGDR